MSEDLFEKKQKEALWTLCVNVIAKDFDKFMSIYESGNYELHYLFGLLQKEKKISILLLQKLVLTKKFKKYMDFLLNPYVGEIHLNGVLVDIAIILEKLKKIAPTITSLKLPKSNFAKSSLPELVCLLTNVEKLYLFGTNISIRTFKCIRENCRNLKYLSIISPDTASDQYIKALCASDNGNDSCNLSERLECLHLECDISMESIICALKHFRNLFDLNHPLVFDAVYKLHAKDIHNDSSNLRNYNLGKLRINTVIDNFPIKFLELCGKLFPHLKELLILQGFSKAHLDALKAFPFLEEIMLGTNKSCDFSSFLQENGRELKRLTICDGTISLDSLLNSCQKLNWLQLGSCSPAIINDTLMLKCIPTVLQYCREISFVNFNIRDDLSKQFVKCLLSCCPNLQYLNFCNWGNHRYGRLDSNFIRLITSSVECIKTLKGLDITHTRIKLSDLKYFVKNASNLETIKLCEDHLCLDDIKCLKYLNTSVTFFNYGYSSAWEYC